VGAHVPGPLIGEPEPSLSIIVATTGRRSLARTLASIAGQLRPGDEVIVARDTWREGGDGGDTARMRAMPQARGSHLAFMDDDDVYAPDGLESMRRFARRHPGRIGIFKMEHPAGTTHWREGRPVLEYANVSTQTFLVPNVPGKLGRWHRIPRPSGSSTYAGDYVFITETVALQGDPVFVDEVTVHARPVRNPIRRLWIRLRYRAAVRTRVRGVLRRLRRRP
jgi:glycosyltransferase involved in cell wall biosynthesis